MKRRIRHIVIGGFALWLVTLSGIVYPQLTAHVGQHEHHSAATHATALCSWLCIAADAVEGTSAYFAPVEQIVFLGQQYIGPQVGAILTVQPPARAPPFA